MLRASAQDFTIFRVNGFRHQHLIAPRHSRGHHGGFGHGGRAVVHGRVRHVHACQLADHRLKLKDGGEGALGDFGLIGRVRREKLAA